MNGKHGDTMVFDSHCHLMRREFLPDIYFDKIKSFIGKEMGMLTGKPISPEEVEEIVTRTFDPTGEITVKRMDDAGISRSVLLSEDMGVGYGEAQTSIWVQIEEIGKIVQKHQDRFIFICQIDPRRPEAVSLFEEGIKKWNVRGYKLNPPAGYDPDDRICYPFFEILSSLGMPLLVHTGAVYGYSDGCHPARLTKILADFPSLIIEACHLGLNWWRELLAIGQENKNLITDFSGFQPSIVGNYGRFCYILRKFIDSWGPERVLFGSDAPAFEHMLSLRHLVALIKDLPNNSPNGTAFTPDEVNIILSAGARWFAIS